MAKIEAVVGREILDSRGNPTVYAEVRTENGSIGQAMVPSGASTGVHEAHELRDDDRKRYGGQGVSQAVKNINTEINAALVGKDTANQNKVDRRMIELDGTVDKKRLGANAILAVSLACARAEASAQGLPLYLYLQQLFPNREMMLPVPQMNVVNGGRHASNGLAIQEFHVVPVGAVNFSEALRMGVEIYQQLKELIKSQGMPVEVADEGGFAPKLAKNEMVFALLTGAIEKAGYLPGVDVFLGIDAAASEFYDKERQVYSIDGAELAAQDLAYQYKVWRERYPLISVEDPFEQDQWEAWSNFTKRQGAALQVVGDDLYCTNSQRLQQGIVLTAANAVLIKPNQVGTLTETLQAILMAQEAKQGVVISHRSGETEDSFIADLAVVVGAGQIKTGAPARSDRTSKYNRLLQIEAEIQGKLAKPFQRYLGQNQPHDKTMSTPNAKAQAMV